MLSAGLVLDILVHSFSMKSVEAQQNSKSLWEHCRVYSGGSIQDNFGKHVSRAYIDYFQSSGIKREEVLLSEGSDYLGMDALSQAIAKLGEQGWEMVSVEAHENSSYSQYYFKRMRR